MLDVNDSCPEGNTNWLSTTGTDKDDDGCRDASEDQDLGTGDDEDNDGIFGTDTNNTELDKCEDGDKGWTSISTSTDPAVTITDYDGDGCRDAGEDTDDDNDDKADADDSCSAGDTGWMSNDQTDNDGDGCQDSGEDTDDDNDGLIDIATAEELINIRHDLDGTHYNDGSNSSDAGCPTTNPVGCKGYELLGDIDLVAPVSPDTKNWDPVAGDFTATLEGNGFTISNLTISNGSTDTGFFAVLRGTVQNLNFVGGSVTSTHVGNSRTGVLAGYNYGTISGVSAGVSVLADNGNYDNVGGLVGLNNGTIQNSSATGKTDGGGGNDLVGGLVGYNIGTIGNSYATGKVIGGAGNDRIGGLVGVVASIIQSSYATGKVDGGAGNDWVGGLVGQAYNLVRSVTIQNSYSLGDVNGGEGADKVGHLLGGKSTGGIYPKAITITSNYYNSGGNLNFVASDDTEQTLTDSEALGKTSDQLKAINLDTPDNQVACEAAGGTWDDTASSCTSGNLTGWNAFNWEFQAGFYPTLKSYKVENNAQTAGDLLCGQLPVADFVQCPTP